MWWELSVAQLTSPVFVWSAQLKCGVRAFLRACLKTRKKKKAVAAVGGFMFMDDLFHVVLEYFICASKGERRTDAIPHRRCFEARKLLHARCISLFFALNSE